jgi:hypothetical protein
MSMPVNELSDRVGQELFVSDWVVVGLDQELAFQAATLLRKEDLGFDPASDDPYGPELVSGFLLLSLLVHFHKKHRLSPAEGLYGLNYGTDRVRFLAPVMAGQRVRVVTENTLELEGSQRPAMVADWITYHTPAPADLPRPCHRVPQVPDLSEPHSPTADPQNDQATPRHQAMLQNARYGGCGPGEVRVGSLAVPRSSVSSLACTRAPWLGLQCGQAR